MGSFDGGSFVSLNGSFEALHAFEYAAFMSDPLKSKPTSSVPAGPLRPLWYDPLSPLGSAVRYLAGLSPRFNRVELSVRRNGASEPGPFLGEALDRNDLSSVRSILEVTVHDPRSSLGTTPEVLGTLTVLSRSEGAFGPEERAWVNQIAKELGEKWPHPVK